MYKVMIVDDEALFRDFIRTKLNWARYGFRICCEARHGIEALELAKEHQPDVALVDINMPFMDGLELAGKLKETFPRIIVVLVTGYNEFEYARKAIRIGVEDYLLKPFDEDELIATLQKARSVLQQADEEDILRKDRSLLLCEGLLNRLISQDFDPEQIPTEKSLQQFGLSFQSPKFRIAVVEIDGMYERWSDPKEIGLWKNTVANLLHDLIVSKDGHTVFHDAGGRTVSLVSYQSEADLARYGKPAFQKLCQFVERHFKFTVTVGIGSPVLGYENLHDSYRNAIAAIQHQWIAGQGNVIEFSKLSSQSHSPDYFPAEIHETIMSHLRLQEWDQVEDQIRQVFRSIEINKISIDHAYTILVSMVSLCMSFAIESGQSVTGLWGPDFSPYQKIQSMKSFDESVNWMLDLYRKAMMFSKENRPSKSKEWFEAAKDYIQNHYQDPELTVEEVAGRIFIDASYLRKIFRKNGSPSVSDYITHIRMNKAKELIGTGNSKLSDIAEQVGYSDPNYFSKCFKKRFGMTPRDFERNKSVHGHA